MQDHARDLAIAAVGKNLTYGGGTSAVVFGLAASDLAALGGLLIALVGLGIQIYFKRKADRREAEYHAARMSDLGK